MKRTLRFSTLAGAMVAAVLLTSLAPVSQREANAGPLYLAPNGGPYYGGGYASAYGGYSTYGYGPYGYSRYSGYGYSSPYGYGGYTYVAPRAYVYPTYRSYGIGNGFGTGGTYRGMFDNGYSGSRFYGQPYRPAYNPYGYGGYGPYGY
jgi:hypothetical protein